MVLHCQIELSLLVAVVLEVTVVASEILLLVEMVDLVVEMALQEQTVLLEAVDSQV
jgi:hypothetical protein